MAELKYEIVQHLATIAEGSKGWTYEEMQAVCDAFADFAENEELPEA